MISIVIGLCRRLLSVLYVSTHLLTDRLIVGWLLIRALAKTRHYRKPSGANSAHYRPAAYFQGARLRMMFGGYAVQISAVFLRRF